MKRSHLMRPELVIELMHLSFINFLLLPLCASVMKVKGSLVKRLPLRDNER